MRSVLFLNGPIGVGKTTLGRALAERPFSDAIVRTDQAEFADTLSGLAETCRAMIDSALKPPIDLSSSAD